MKKALFTAILLLTTAFACSAETPVMAKAAEFKTLIEFARGSDPAQLLWLVEDDGSILPGAFKGPMVFRAGSEDTTWIGDTQNGRICAFSRDGKNLNSIDLIGITKKLGLKEIPALLDMLFKADGNLLVADAANNVILEIAPDSSSSRFFAPPEDEARAWMQINYLHTDNAGRIYIEDLALQHTVVLDGNGAVIAVLEHLNCLDTSRTTGRQITLAADDKSLETFRVLSRDNLEKSWQEFATVMEKVPFSWIGIVGFDGADNLYIAYETEDARHYLIYRKDGTLINSLKTQCINPGYDPLYSDWVSSDGKIHCVRIKNDKLHIMQLN